MANRGFLAADWRREAFRTNLWVAPALVTAALLTLLVGTYLVDRAVYEGRMHLPPWMLSGTADSARLILATIAGSIITVTGLVFSITIVALTLASTQFGPRMLRNFVRDRGTQLTLAGFVATFCFAMITLVSVGGGDRGDFVPHLSVTVAMVLTLADVGILIYFLNHVASMIQLPVVIAGIAEALATEIAVEQRAAAGGSGRETGPGADELRARLQESGAPIRTPDSGYLQVVNHETLMKLAVAADAVIHIPFRPGHFLVAGQVMAVVWPPSTAAYIEQNVIRGHVTGPYRTLTQDISFGFDQLVEIALRALSPAVNDTFSALTCVDWIADCLCRISSSWHPQRIRRDDAGRIRVIAHQPDFERLLGRSFEKIRQAADGMPAVMIRQLDALAKVAEQTPDPDRRQMLLRQAELIEQASGRTVAEAADRADVTRHYDMVVALVSGS